MVVSAKKRQYSILRIYKGDRKFYILLIEGDNHEVRKRLL